MRAPRLGDADHRAWLRIEGAEALEVGGVFARQDGEVALDITGGEAGGRTGDGAGADEVARRDGRVGAVAGFRGSFGEG